VHHHELYGLREGKYEWLNARQFKKKNYLPLRPERPYYFFIKRDTAQIKTYAQWEKLTDIFPVNSVGIVTARDQFVVGFSADEIKNRIMQFRNSSLPDEVISHTYDLKDKSNWSIANSRTQIKALPDWDSHIQRFFYRPFDTRFIFYYKALIERMRPEVMHHMLQENLGIQTCRQISGKLWRHILATPGITDDCYVSNITRERGYLFPLYLYPEQEASSKKAGITLSLFEPKVSYGKKGRTPNIAPQIFQKLKEVQGKNLTPEDVLHYIYAVLYSNVYRAKYAEFLRFDFPRIPFTADREVFQTFAGYGRQLVELHLLKGELLNHPIAKYQGRGENDRIEKIQYREAERQVHINDQKYFEGIAPGVWQYHIGGYQVLHKFLKDRRGRLMDDPRHYSRIVTAIAKTIEIQELLDKIYDSVERNLFKFETLDFNGERL